MWNADTISDAWEKGIIDGWQSVHPGMTPGKPMHPLGIASSLPDDKVNDRYYELGYERGRTDAQG